MEWTHTEQVLQNWADDFLQRLKDRLIRDDKYASGDLLASLQTTVVANGNELTVWLTSEDYLQYINNGTEPHFPPRAPIEKWIEDKGIEPYPDKNGKLPTVQGLAFLICRKISQVGTEADPVVDDTVREVNEIYMSRIEEAIIQDLDDEVRAILIDSMVW